MHIHSLESVAFAIACTCTTIVSSLSRNVSSDHRQFCIVKMSHPVTEIAYLPIKDGFDVASGEGKSIWDATLKTITSQKGCKRLSWGKQIETPSITQMAIGKCLPSLA